MACAARPCGLVYAVQGPGLLYRVCEPVKPHWRRLLARPNEARRPPTQTRTPLEPVP